MSDKDKSKKMSDPSESAGDRNPMDSALEKSTGVPPESRAYAEGWDEGTEPVPYTETSQEMYVDRMKANLDERGIDIKTLMSQAEGAEATVRSTYLQQFENLKALQETASQALQALAGSGESAWRTMTSTVDKAYDDLRSAVEAAASRFRK